MGRNSRWWAWLTVIVIGVVSLAAACGGDDDGTTSAESAAPAATSAAEAPATEAATSEAATEAATEEATSEATEAATEEATSEATEAATSEATEAATEAVAGISAPTEAGNVKKLAFFGFWKSNSFTQAVAAGREGGDGEARHRVRRPHRPGLRRPGAGEGDAGPDGEGRRPGLRGARDRPGRRRLRRRRGDRQGRQGRRRVHAVRWQVRHARAAGRGHVRGRRDADRERHGARRARGLGLCRQVALQGRVPPGPEDPAPRQRPHGRLQGRAGRGGARRRSSLPSPRAATRRRPGRRPRRTSCRRTRTST